MIALIDGDVLAYDACSSRWQAGATKLDIYGKAQLDMSPAQKAEFTETSWWSFNKLLRDMLETLYCKDYLMAVKSGPSFRDLMYPIILNETKTKAIWGYKANRWKPAGTANEFVRSVRERAIHNEVAMPATLREADDWLRIWATEAEAAGEDYVVCSIDKDLDCIPGKHWRMKEKKLVEVSPEAAKRSYYVQLLKGDPTDNIPGVPGIGDVKGASLLASCKTDAEFQETVISYYLSAYGDDWFGQFLSNAKMIHLQRHQNDYFDVNEWPILKELR